MKKFRVTAAHMEQISRQPLSIYRPHPTRPAVGRVRVKGGFRIVRKGLSKS